MSTSLGEIDAGAEPIKVAVIGLGKIARDQHLPTLQSDGRFVLAAGVDPQAALGGVPNFPTAQALFESRTPLDAAAICTPPQARAEIARQAIAAGKHVLLEKPPAATLSHLTALGEQARAAGVTLFAAWHSRFAPLLSEARAALAGRRVTGGCMAWKEDVRVWHAGQSWIWAPGGLGVFDAGINAFSILTALLAETVTVEDATLHIPENLHTPLRANLTLGAGPGIIDAAFDFAQPGPPTWEIALHAAGGGGVVLSEGGAALRIDGGPVRRAPSAEYAGVYGRFAELIAAGQSEADPAPLALVADALRSGRRIGLPAFDPAA
jgi:D-galactose 1-dehydrogenase